MQLKEKKVNVKSKAPISSIVMYVIAIVVAIIAIASLVNDITLFNSSVKQYVAQGYTKAQVTKQLIPGQLLPGIFETVAVYLGIAIILISAGIINHKISKCLKILSKADVNDTVIEESIINENAVEEISEDNDQSKQPLEN